jgi:uncharacterized protein (TIGR02594 family)
MQPSSARLVAVARPVIVPPWMPIALGELGVLEDTRVGKSNPRVEGFHAITSGGAAVDDVPWCASFVGWALEQAAIRSTRSKMAASYATWGVECPFVFGCVVLMKPSDPDAGGSGHVGFGLSLVGNDRFYLLGGNQSDRVGIDIRKVADIAARRWPVGQPIPQAA